MTTYEISINYRNPNVVDIDGEEEYIYKIPKDIINHLLLDYMLDHNKYDFRGRLYIWKHSINIHKIKCGGEFKNKSWCSVKTIHGSHKKYKISSLLNSLAVKYLYHGILHQTDNSFYRYTKNECFEPHLSKLIAKFLV